MKILRTKFHAVYGQTEVQPKQKGLRIMQSKDVRSILGVLQKHHDDCQKHGKGR